MSFTSYSKINDILALNIVYYNDYYIFLLKYATYS